MTKMNWNRPPPRGLGAVLDSAMARQGPKKRCRHQWTAWRRIAIFDSTETRKCKRCGKKGRRKPANPQPVAQREPASR